MVSQQLLLNVFLLAAYIVTCSRAFSGNIFTGRICTHTSHLKRQNIPHSRDSLAKWIIPKLSNDDGDGGGKDVGDGGNKGGGGGGRGDEGGSESEGDDLPAAVVALLAAAGKKVTDLPTDLQKAVASGKLPEHALKQFLDFESSALMSFLMKTQGFRDRMMMDGSFITKCAIEVGIGGTCQLFAEISERGDKFLSQLDFVTADVLTCVIANFVAVWTAAPTIKSILTAGVDVSQNKLQQFLASCPTNAFQKVVPGTEPFTLAQRCGTMIAAFPNLFFVGFTASIAGFGITLALSKLREMMNPEIVGESEDIQVLKPALVIGAYLGISTNLRYQIVAGLFEQRLLDQIFPTQKLLNNLGSLFFRTANTYVGSAQMVMTLKLTGLAGDSEESSEEAPLADEEKLLEDVTDAPLEDFEEEILES